MSIDVDTAQLSLFYRPRPKVHREPHDSELEAALEDIDSSLEGHEAYERALRTVRHLLLVGAGVIDYERVAELAQCDTGQAYHANVAAVLAGWGTPACSTFAKIRKT